MSGWPPGAEECLGWTNENVFRLVNELRLRPLLWDPNDDMYRVQTAKYEAWLEIARVFDCDVADLKKKFNSIFASHRREKSKVRFGKRSRWFLYDRLSFLPSHVENPKASGELPDDAFQKDTEESCQEENDRDREGHSDTTNEEVIVKSEPEEMPPLQKFACKGPRPTRLVRRVLRKPKTARDRSLAEAVSIIKGSSPAKRKDECDSFGEYIAVSLRKHDERTRAMIKQAINNILFEQEMNKYNGGHFVDMENPLIIGDDNGECSH